MEDHEDSEKRERVLLRPWLENLIESGSVPGLEWIDNTKTTFKVPWKHRSKKTWSLKHSSIFLEWAKNTGRWSEGDPEPNYAQLKTRLRCAFNKAPDIEEMKELHRTKTEEPYKVYKFIPRKESKLYPFGRRPLRKTTVPITVKRRRYLISRISTCGSMVASRCNFHDISRSTAATHRIKQEKDDQITGFSTMEKAKEGCLNATPSSQGWTQSSWLHEQRQGVEVTVRDPWSTLYNHEAKDQNTNCILPLIVEEENFNLSATCEVDLPTKDERELKPKSQHSILPVIGSNCVPAMRPLTEVLPEKSRSAHEDHATNVSQTFVQSTSVLPVKFDLLRTYNSACWNSDSSSIYVNSRLSNLPSSDSFNDSGKHHILPSFHQDQTRKYCGAFTQQLANGAEVVSEQWVYSAPEKRSVVNQSLECLVQEPITSSLVQVSDNSSSGGAGGLEHRTGRIPAAARLFPLKNRYNLPHGVGINNDVSPADSVTSQKERRKNALVKPNTTAQPQVAVAVPFDGKIHTEKESASVIDGSPNNIPEDISKNAGEESGLRSAELDVIDLSMKFSVNNKKDLETKVLDLTKKMVVTPFERDIHAAAAVSATKSNLPDTVKELDESHLASDQAFMSSTMAEILKLKADCKRKKQLIVTKTMFLVEKERELNAKEKQLAAREEALFWKENYLHKVMSGVELSAIPNMASGRIAGAVNHSLAGGLLAGSTIPSLASGPLFPAAISSFSSSPLVAAATPSLARGSIVGATKPFASMQETSVNLVESRESKDEPVAVSLPQNTPAALRVMEVKQKNLPMSNDPKIAQTVPPAGPSKDIQSLQLTAAVVRSSSSSLAYSSGSPVSTMVSPTPLTLAAVPLKVNTANKHKTSTVLSPVVHSTNSREQNTHASFEPETVGDDSTSGKSCNIEVATEKLETDVVSYSTVEEVQSPSVLLTRKRGRPKGSKNKAKLPRAGDNFMLKQMPPLMVIQSPYSREPVGVDPTGQTAFPFHMINNGNVPGIAMAASRLVGVPDVPITRAVHPGRDRFPLIPTSSFNKNVGSMSRILPPVTSCSVAYSNYPVPQTVGPRFGIPIQSESVSRLSRPYPHSDVIMPDTVRQLLLSAARPVSNILPPLSPSKSPDLPSSPQQHRAAINLCNETPHTDENRN